MNTYFYLFFFFLSYQEKLHKIQTSNSISSDTTDHDVGVLCCSFQVSKSYMPILLRIGPNRVKYSRNIWTVA